MEGKERTSFSCPTCGNPLHQDGRSFHCEEHGVWQLYGASLLVQAPSDEFKVRDRFTMPWEAAPQAI